MSEGRAPGTWQGTAAAWLLVAALTLMLLTPLIKAWGVAVDLGHGWAAPLLIAYLYWERYDERPGPVVRASVGAPWWAAAIFLGGLLVVLRLVVTPFPLWAAVMWLYVGVLVTLALGAAGLIGGWAAVRWVGGPLVIMAGALPWPYQIDAWLVQPLRVALATIAADLINLTGQPALSSGTTVQFAAGWVGVDEACGGIRSLQASVMMALFFGEWLRLSVGRRVSLVAVGLGAALLGNFLRILFLAWRATVSEAAVQSAHDLAGWLALAVSLALTGFFGWWWARAKGADEATVAKARAPRVAGAAWSGGVGRALAGLGVGLLVVEAGNFAWYHLGERRRAAVPQWTVQFPSAHWSYRNVPLPEASREMLRPDLYAAGTWRAGEREAGAYYVEWHRGQAARFLPVHHNPTVCLPLAGCELIEPLEMVQVKWAGGEIPFQTYLFRRASERFVVAFAVWDPSAGAPLGQNTSTKSRWEWLRRQWRDVAEARENQPGQLLTVTLMGAKTAGEMQTLIAPLIVRADPNASGRGDEKR